MPISSALCTSYKQEILSGVHLSSDTYKIALFTSAASLGASTTVYSTTDEVVGTGYSAGGATLSGFVTGSSGTTAWIDWTTDPSWGSSTITARGALIYNASQGNKAVATFDFGSDKTTNDSTFTVVLPDADATNAIVRIE